MSRTFTSSASIAINTFGSASPFPAVLSIAGFKKGTVTDVDLVLNGFTHGRTRDIDIMLVGPDGGNALVMSDVGKQSYSAGITIRLDDQAEVDIPDATSFELVSGTYRPANIDDGSGLDVFHTRYAPIPMASGSSSFAMISPAQRALWQTAGSSRSPRRSRPRTRRNTRSGEALRPMKH